MRDPWIRARCLDCGDIRAQPLPFGTSVARLCCRECGSLNIEAVKWTELPLSPITFCWKCGERSDERAYCRSPKACGFDLPRPVTVQRATPASAAI